MDRQIKLDELTHTYTNEVGEVYTSVTTLIGKYHKPFDKEYWAVWTVLKEMGFDKMTPDPDNRRIFILGVPFTLQQLFEDPKIKLQARQSKLEDRWKKLTDESCALGSKKHNYLEDSVNNMYYERPKLLSNNSGGGTVPKLGIVVNRVEIENSDLKNKYPSIYRLLIELLNKDYVLYAERRVYLDWCKVCGTIDLLAVRGTDFIIVDWKTNKDEMKFTSGYYKKQKVVHGGKTHYIKSNTWIDTEDNMSFPINNLSYCKGVIYTLQLSMYANMLESYGYKCLKLILVHIRNSVNPITNLRTEHEPLFYTLNYLKEDTERMLTHFHSQNLLKNNKHGINTETKAV